MNTLKLKSFSNFYTNIRFDSYIRNLIYTSIGFGFSLRPPTFRRQRFMNLPDTREVYTPVYVTRRRQPVVARFTVRW